MPVSLHRVLKSNHYWPSKYNRFLTANWRFGMTRHWRYKIRSGGGRGEAAPTSTTQNS